MRRRGPGAAALYYGHTRWVLAAPALVVRHPLWAPLHLAGLLTLLYLGGIVLKECVWGLAISGSITRGTAPGAAAP